ncbi:MAG: homocitrate synthase [Clostridia bacterium]
MKQAKYIVDTTLRDGEQSPFVNLSWAQKQRIAQRLDEIGVSQIEAGVVALSVEEQECICKIIEHRKNADISVWARMHAGDVSKALECNPQVVHISIPVSYLHIYKKLGKNKMWVIRQLQEILEVVSKGKGQLSVGFEDASRAELSFLVKILNIIESFGDKVKMVRIADTVGGTAPFGHRELMANLCKQTKIPLEIHGHNDLGLAVPNTLEALKLGATYADTTLLGVGERSGNCHFSKFINLANTNFDFGISIEDAKELEEEFRRMIQK